MISNVETTSTRWNRRLAVYVSGICIILITVLLVLDASLRTFLAKPILGLIDVVEVILAWIVFTAFAHALITGAHVRMTLVVDRLPFRARSGCDIFGSLIGVVFFALLTVLAVPYFWHSWLIKEVPMSPVGTPVWLGKAAMPIGSFIMFTAFVIRLMRSLRPKREVVAEEEIKGS